MLNTIEENKELEYLEQRIQKLEVIVAQQSLRSSSNKSLSGKGSKSARTTQRDKNHVFSYFKEKLEPEVISLTGFSISVYLLGFMKVGVWEAESNFVFAFWGFFLGGLMQIQGGHYQHKNGDAQSAWISTVFGYNWLASGAEALFVGLGLATLTGPKVAAARALWFCFFSLANFVLSFRISIYCSIMTFAVFLSFFFEFISYFAGNNPWNVISGAFSIISATLAGALAFGILANLYFERKIVPTFAYKRKTSDVKLAQSMKIQQQMDDQNSMV